MSKFKANDRIRVNENGFEAVIHAVSFNSIYQETEYYIMWDNFPEKGLCCYNASDVDSMWDSVANIVKALEAAEPDRNYVNQDGEGLPPGFMGIDFGYLPEDKKKECDHKWVNASLMFEKMCCYHCGIDKP
jgi:hypothetical protein